MVTQERRSSISSRTKRITAALSAALLASTSHSVPAQAWQGNPKTPIKHVIVIIGENWTFDSLFATYKPANKGEYVLNLLSKKIVKENGRPGPNYGEALQYKAYNKKKYKFAPPKTPYDPYLPPAALGGPTTPYVCTTLGYKAVTQCVSSANIQAAKQYQDGLPDDYYQYLLTGGTGYTKTSPVQPDPASIMTATTRAIYRPDLSRLLRKPCHMIPTLQARFTASTKCGSSSIATPPPLIKAMGGAAAMTSSPGWK
jgi:phospholipase C